MADGVDVVVERLCKRTISHGLYRAVVEFTPACCSRVPSGTHQCMGEVQRVFTACGVSFP